MMGFPIELVTLAGSTIMGLVVKVIAAKAEAAAGQHRMLLEKAGLVEGSRTAARSWGGQYVAWTRRVIALTVVASVFVVPPLMLLAGFPLLYGVPAETGWIWARETTEWWTLWGAAITPLHTHAAMAVIGLYFGTGRLQ